MSASAQIFGRDSAIHKVTNILGLGIPTWLDKKFGPKAADDPVLNTDPGQTSTYGAFITRTHGTIGQSGNIIWLEGNKLRAVVKKAKKSGKGGGAPAAAATVSYFATFAVGLCEGPIAGVRRIWIGPDLIYDAGSDDLETIISSNQAMRKFKLYLGAEGQQPDPRIQADRGVANTPSYAGLAYIVITDLALANYGNSIAGAQIKVEVVNSLATLLPSYFEPLPAAISASERITFADENGYQTAEALSGYVTGSSIGVDAYISQVIFRDYTLGGLLIKKETKENSITLQGTSNLSFYKSLYISGVKSTSCAYRGSGTPEISIAPGVPLSIGDLSQSSTQFRSFAGGYWWFFGAFSNSRLSPSSETVYTIPGADAQSVVVIEDTETGRVYRRWTENATTNKYIEEINPDSLAVIWQTLLGNSSSGWADGFNVFSVSGGVVTLCGGGKMRSYDVTGSSAVLVSTSQDSPSPDDVYGYATGFAIKGKTAGGGIWRATKTLAPQAVPLSSIVASEMGRAALINPADIDTAGLSGSVIGYRVTSSGSIRNALEPLRAAYPFDAFQSGYKIKFRSRGTASVATIPIGDLAADTQLEESREMDSQLPSRVTVQYLDRNRDYDQNEQEDARLGAADGDVQDVSIQVVMTGAQAKQVAEKLLTLAWLERTPYSFKLPPIYGRIEAADTITIVADYATYELRLNSVSPDSDGMLSCSGVPSNASLYTSSTPADEGQQPPITIPLKGSTYGALIDCPVIDETLQNSPGFIVGFDGYSSGWPGGTLFRSTDSGQAWADVQAFSGRATIGYASSMLGANSGNLIQRGGSLVVSAGNLESVTEAQMLGGSNVAAYGAPGRWEVIRFQNATLNGDGTYTLDTFWRGDKGTEWATGLHVAGDAFVLLTDPDLAFVGMATESIDLPRDYRMVTFGADLDSAASQSFTYSGANLKCLSPVYARGVRASGDLAVTWTRRSRISSSWWTNGVAAPIGETAEAYEVDVMSGSTVKRTLSSSTPSVTYTSAQQVEDFGSVQSAISLKLYQLSTAVGRGLPLEITL